MECQHQNTALMVIPPMEFCSIRREDMQIAMIAKKYYKLRNYELPNSRNGEHGIAESARVFYELLKTLEASKPYTTLKE